MNETTKTREERIAELKAEARELQRIQYNAAKRQRRGDARAFGNAEAKLDRIWREIDRLRS